MSEISHFPKAPKNLIIPLEICSLIINPVTSDTELNFLDLSNQVYGKALHGQNKISFKNGNKYEGEFENGMLHGHGSFIWTNGVKYEGDFYYNKLIGKGRFDWPDGSFYEGDVHYGFRHGKGLFTTPNGESFYNGDWFKGMRHGYGKLSFKSGGFYEGSFYQGNKHGKGRMVYASGNYYEGDWQFDKKKGDGLMYWVNTKEKFYGSWDDNRQNGLGIHIWLESKGEGKYLRNRYDGEWDTGQRHGVGTFYYANGAKYEGKWNRNLKDGYALFTNEAGKLSFSVFKDDKLVNSLEMERKPQIIENLEGNFENNLEVMKEMLNQNQEEILINKEERLPSANKSKLNANSPSMRKTKKKLFSDKKDGSSHNELAEFKKKELEANPFYELINIEDLLIEGYYQNKELLMKNLTNMLLRHNPLMKKIYKFYANSKNIPKDSEDPLENENILGMNLQKMWTFVKDLKIMSPNMTLAMIDRLFYQGVKNRYDLKVPFDELKAKLQILIEASDKNNFPTTDTNELFIFDYINKYEENGRINTEFSQNVKKNIIMKNINIHDGGRVVLYRHFVEIIVRMALLKYGGLNELHRSVEKILIQKIEPLLEQKKKKMKDASFHSTDHLGKFTVINDFRNDMLEIFKSRVSKSQNFVYGRQDETILVKTCIDLLNKAKMIDSENDKNILFHFFERFYDSDDSFSNYEHQYQLLISQSTVSLEKKDKEKKNSKEKEKEREYTLNKNKKIALLVEAEILFEEFMDSLTYFFLKKKDNNLKNDIEIEEYLQMNFKIFISNHKKLMKKSILVEGRLFPLTEKDKMFEVVKTVQYERKIEEMNRQEQLRQSKQEEFERYLMEKENIDIDLNEKEEENEDILIESEESLY